LIRDLDQPTNAATYAGLGVPVALCQIQVAKWSAPHAAVSTPGVVILELRGAQVAEGGVQPASVVDRDLVGNPFRGRMRCDIDPDNYGPAERRRGHRADRSQSSEQRTGPWRRCPVRGYAGAPIPGTAVDIASPSTSRRWIDRPRSRA